MRDLSGSWTGMFSYPGELGAISFHVELREFDGTLSGLSHEFEDIGDGRGELLLAAIIEGARSGTEVEFRKTYDEFDPITVVDYFGSVDADGDEIHGEWVRIEDMLSGPFVMRRAKEVEEEVAEEAEATVD